MTVCPPIGEDVCTTTKKSTGVVTTTTAVTGMLTTAYPTLGESATIIDTDGPKTVPIMVNGIMIEIPSFKACTHTKTTRSVKEGTGFHVECENSASKYSLTKLGSPGYGTDWVSYYSLKSLVSRGLCLDPTDVWNSFSSIASAFAKQSLLDDSSLLGFQGSFNVLSFIGELRDVKHLPDLVTKWHKSTHDVSDKFLGYNFGFVPFASDIKNIADRVVDTGPHIDKWNSMAANGKVLNTHRLYHIDGRGVNVGTEKKPIWETKASYQHGGGTCSYPCTGRINYFLANHVVRQTFKAVVHVYFVPMNIPDTEIGALKRAIWGVDKPLTAAWNLIPFSFVVDWFVNIGDLIQQFEASQPHLKFRLVSAGCSLKVTTEHTMFWGLSQIDDSLGTCTTTTVNYFRTPLDPKSLLAADKYYSSLNFKLLDQNQAVLGSALMHQLLR